MHVFTPTALLETLRSCDIPDDAPLCVAFSGGLDSTVLLHALAKLNAERCRYRLRAMHVDHQLHARSGEWRTTCEQIAATLGVSLTSVTVAVQSREEGLEAAARRARYDALRERLASGEILLTAHHADDQLETVLLALVRGAGVSGLSGALADQRFGSGRLVRPLLGYTRAELERWARSERCSWIEDPSNENADLDRNFLRLHVTPLLRTRWPAAARGAARSAAHLAEARRLLEAIARADLDQLRSKDGIDVQRLIALEPARRRNALRRWFRELGVRSPAARKLTTIERDLLTAGPDRCPCVEWDDVELHRYRGQLYLERQQARSSSVELAWDPAAPLHLPEDAGRLSVRSDPDGPLSASKLGRDLRVRFRVGGERFRPAGERHRRSLKKMLQAAGVPPWRRERLPLIYVEDRLAAVGDLWVAEEFSAHDRSDAVRIVWEHSNALDARGPWS